MLTFSWLLKLIYTPRNLMLSPVLLASIYFGGVPIHMPSGIKAFIPGLHAINSDFAPLISISLSSKNSFDMFIIFCNESFDDATYVVSSA